MMLTSSWCNENVFVRYIQQLKYNFTSFVNFMLHFKTMHARPNDVGGQAHCPLAGLHLAQGTYPKLLLTFKQNIEQSAIGQCWFNWVEVWWALTFLTILVHWIKALLCAVRLWYFCSKWYVECYLYEYFSMFWCTELSFSERVSRKLRFLQFVMFGENS